MWREAKVFTEAERAALDLTEQGTRIADAAGGVTDEAWANAGKHYDDDQLATLVALIALINTYNRINAIGDDVTVELTQEGPQRGDLADDIAAAFAANPAAGAFFDTLAQFYRKAYLRWIDATTRRPDVRAARIAEVVDLLAAGIKQRPRS